MSRIANDKYVFLSDISVGNFGLPFKTYFKNYPASQANMVLPFTVWLKFAECLGKWPKTRLCQVRTHKCKHHDDPIYTGDGSSVCDKPGQKTVARLIIRLCINTGKQTDHLPTQAIAIVCLVRWTIIKTDDPSACRIIRQAIVLYPSSS